MSLIVLPTQLYLDIPEGIKTIYIVEHPFYFTRLNFHKLKLAFHKCSMLNYRDTIKKQGNHTVKFITYDKYNTFIKKVNETFTIFDPIDIPVYTEFEKLKVNIIDTPSFLITSEQCNDIKFKRLSAFYNNMKKIIKKEHNIDYTNLKNLDKMNRKSIPLKELSNLKENVPKYTNKHYTKSITYINKHFNKNFGELSLDTLKEIPVTHTDADKHLKAFIDYNFAKFGPYQDFISQDHFKLYHSNISHLINVGLLTPLQVLIQVNKVRDKVPKESFEGFIRQVIGWREYMRYIYIKNPELTKENFWKNNKSLDWNKFYGYTPTGITFLDHEIDKIKTHAWSHHIVRLMIFLNYFVLAGIKPTDILRWFQETIALDSYEWVMVSNIWTMGYFTKTYTTRPYISSGNYIKKMSSYRNPEDFKKFDKLYRDFKESKKDFKFYRFG